MTPADNLFLYVGTGHMHSLAQPIEEFRAAKIIQVVTPDILPSLILLQQRPLIAIPQPEIIVPASRIIRVPLADVFAPPAVGRKLRRRWFRSGG